VCGIMCVISFTAFCRQKQQLQPSTTGRVHRELLDNEDNRQCLLLPLRGLLHDSQLGAGSAATTYTPATVAMFARRDFRGCRCGESTPLIVPTGAKTRHAARLSLSRQGRHSSKSKYICSISHMTQCKHVHINVTVSVAFSYRRKHRSCIMCRKKIDNTNCVVALFTLSGCLELHCLKQRKSSRRAQYCSIKKTYGQFSSSYNAGAKW